VREYERLVVFRLGRLVGERGPGLVLLIPIIDRPVKVGLRTVTMDVPPQDIITKDNVTVKVNAVIYFRVISPQEAVVQVENYLYATSQIAQTTLRSILGQAELDELLAEREKLNLALQQVIDRQTEPWGVKVSTVEVKNVDLPQEMQRAIAKQAEAERERRSKVIGAEGEFQAAQKMVDAATWLKNYYPNQSWLVPAHPERKKDWTVGTFRALNDQAPRTAFGFESMPGHQKGTNRGEYAGMSVGGGTYGGCGIYAAKVGGLWDAMLGEGRAWWLFANSDFHNDRDVGTSQGADFWPGEYQKTYTYVTNRNDAAALLAGLRSGNNWVVAESDWLNPSHVTIALPMIGPVVHFLAESICTRRLSSTAPLPPTIPCQVTRFVAGL
jgi:hypothetical protein